MNLRDVAKRCLMEIWRENGINNNNNNNNTILLTLLLLLLLLLWAYSVSRKACGRVPLRSLNCFNLRNLSSLAQPLTEMGTRSRKIMLLGSRARTARRADKNSRHLWVYCLETVRASTSHNPIGLHGQLQEYIFLLIIIIHFDVAYSATLFHCLHLRINSIHNGA
jgi:hypothetical protein